MWKIGGQGWREGRIVAWTVVPVVIELLRRGKRSGWRWQGAGVTKRLLGFGRRTFLSATVWRCVADNEYALSARRGLPCVNRSCIVGHGRQKGTSANKRWAEKQAGVRVRSLVMNRA